MSKLKSFFREEIQEPRNALRPCPDLISQITLNTQKIFYLWWGGFHIHQVWPSKQNIKKKLIKDRAAKKPICEQLLECPSSANLPLPPWSCLLCWKHTPCGWVVGQWWEPHPPAQGLRGVIQGHPGGLESKESTCYAGDPGSIPGLGRSTGEGKGYTQLQYSGLENFMDCIVHGVTRVGHDWATFTNPGLRKDMGRP